ncbi:MAG: hypothetical protein ACREV9_06650 [Burkholderiales bacterium]
MKALALSCLLFLASVVNAAPEQVAEQKQRLLNEGYSLLYDIVSKQGLAEKILLIKFESKEVKAVIMGIADAAERIRKDLDEMAKKDPRLELKLHPLPLMEVETRKSANFERVKDLLGKSGKEFERLLLLTQSGVLNSERHLTKVLSEKETDKKRKAFTQDAHREIDQQYQRVVQLLEAQYFTPTGKRSPGTADRR